MSEVQVIIDEVVSNFRMATGGAALSTETLRTVVRAALEAIDKRDRQRENHDEEHSLQNYQQRNQPWNR
jgi:hypothetical protein